MPGDITAFVKIGCELIGAFPAPLRLPVVVVVMTKVMQSFTLKG